MIRQKNDFLKLLFTCICLSSGSVIAAPTPTSSVISPQIPEVSSIKPGTLLSVEPQQPSSILSNADKRFVVNYRSRGVKGSQLLPLVLFYYPKEKYLKEGGQYWLGHMVPLV